MSARPPNDTDRATRGATSASAGVGRAEPLRDTPRSSAAVPLDGGDTADMAFVRAGSTSTRVLVEDASQVAQARREALALGRQTSLDAAAADRLALAVTEAATNLVKHASGGSVLLAPLADTTATGIEVIALDRGPGMSNVAASMRDGHSTAGSPGFGLGSMSRLASNLDIYSQPGAGTVLRFEVWSTHAPQAPGPVAFGGVCVAKAGEAVSGDGWLVQSAHGRHRVVVVDGVGHGLQAATAARNALRIARENDKLEPAAVLESMHAALRSTRGAAAAVAAVAPHAAHGVFAGIGNIRSLVHSPDTTRNLVSHNGTLGHQVRKFQAFDFAFPARALLLLHSDGIATHWRFDRYPGLERHHPAVIAATIYRDYARGHDDATVVVLRNDARVAS
jgi:anti-sigma regulatory factor (Ser/Thr protein kinase)